jgi:hypothetical protein
MSQMSAAGIISGLFMLFMGTFLILAAILVMMPTATFVFIIFALFF